MLACHKATQNKATVHLVLRYQHPFTKTRRHPQNRKGNATPSEEDREPHAYRKFDMKFGLAVLEICMRTDRQTDTHTHHSTPLRQQERIE